MERIIKFINVEKNFWPILLLIFLSYFSGFVFNENHGGAKEDLLLHTYPAIISFKLNGFKDTIYNYGQFQELTYPLHHILHGLFNPSIENIILFRTTTLFISLISIYLIFLNLKNKFKLKNKICVLISSLILLSPYYRGSAFFGLHEVTGYLFLLLTLYYFNNIKKNNTYNIIFICVFSSLALYTRNQYVFLPIFFLFYFFLNHKYSNLGLAFAIYSIFSIPGLYLIYIWNGLIHPEFGEPISSYINLVNIPFGVSVFFCNLFLFIFPFWIFYIATIDTNKLKNFIKKNFFYFVFILCFFLSLYNLLNFDIFKNGTNQGKIFGLGSVIKYINYFFPKYDWVYLIISSLSLVFFINIIKMNLKNFILSTLIIFLFSIRIHLYTEYFDPLFFILFLFLFDLKKFKYNLTVNYSFFFIVFFIYNTTILLLSFISMVL